MIHRHTSESTLLRCLYISGEDDCFDPDHHAEAVYRESDPDCNGPDLLNGAAYVCSGREYCWMSGKNNGMYYVSDAWLLASRWLVA